MLKSFNVGTYYAAHNGRRAALFKNYRQSYYYTLTAIFETLEKNNKKMLFSSYLT